jgi:hypothetical protein
MSYPKSANHNVDNWELTNREALKKKSMLLVKKLRVARKPFTPNVMHSYIHLGIQLDKMKLKFF